MFGPINEEDAKRIREAQAAKPPMERRAETIVLTPPHPADPMHMPQAEDFDDDWGDAW